MYLIYIYIYINYYIYYYPFNLYYIFLERTYEQTKQSRSARKGQAACIGLKHKNEQSNIIINSLYLIIFFILI